MTTRKELYKLIDQLDKKQFDNAKVAITNILQGNPNPQVPICDLGSLEDVATLYQAIIYNEKNKI